MRPMGLQGVVRGKTPRTTFSDQATPCPQDHVHRPFCADRPKALWVSDFTSVSTGQGLVYVAFVIDVLARRIVGGKVSRSARTDFVLDALEQALYARQPAQPGGGLIPHRDRGVQYVSIRSTDRRAEARMEPAVDRGATRMTTRGQKPSTASTKPRGFTGHPGITVRRSRSSGLLWRGWTGTALADGSSRWGTYRPQKLKQRIIDHSKSPPGGCDSNQRVSGIPGAVQNHCRLCSLESGTTSTTTAISRYPTGLE